MSAPTLPAALLEHARTRGSAVALRQHRRGIWAQHTWAEYASRAAAVGLGLRALDVGPGERVAILARNRVEWVVTDLAAQGIGAVTVGVFPSSPPNEVAHVLRDASVGVLVVEDEEQLDKALAVRAEVPTLRRIVVMVTRGIASLADEMLLSFEELEDRGAAADAGEWATAVATLDPGALATVVYTSGTTDLPKGVCLTHANLAAAAAIVRDVVGVGPEDEVLSALPLGHISERLVSVVGSLTAGGVVSFGTGPESLLTDLVQVQPTVVLGVPRLWEQLAARAQLGLGAAGRVKGGLARWAQRRGAAVAAARMAGEHPGFGTRIGGGVAQVVALRALRTRLGLRRVRVALCGAAPVATPVLEWLWSVGVPVREVYGLTESTGLATMMPVSPVRLGTVGTALPGVEVRVAGDGEVQVRGPGVCAGYLGDAPATAATIDADGWLHTGDVGELDADGYLTITDRRKDIIITASGAAVPPQVVERRLAASPYIREAVVIGDRRPFLGALVGIEPTTVGAWCRARGVAYTTYRDLVGRPEVTELVASVVESVNEALASHEQVARFALLDVELEAEEGEVTPTDRVRRRAVEARFAPLIEGMFA